MIQNKISKITYEEVKKELGSEFYMPYDQSDVVRRIAHENGWNLTKKELMDRWGDVEVIIDKDAKYWSDQVKIIDAEFMAAQRRYEDDKAAWCSKYGCD